MGTNNKNAECPICTEVITDPVTMPCCKNRFCISCLASWKNRFEDYVNGNRTCPCCRALCPPTQHVLSTIGFYKTVSLSLRILMQDPFIPTLPLPPFTNVGNLNQGGTRDCYENYERAYGGKVRRFEQKYGPRQTIILPSPPQKPIHLPVSVTHAVRYNEFYKVLQFLGSLPVPPQRLNATCPNESGNTILHTAVQANNLDMVNALLALGANVDATNSERLTPLYYAVIMHAADDRVAKTLIRWGAKKVSTIDPSNSSLNPTSTDHLLAATAVGFGKPMLASMLECEIAGRQCKVLVAGVTRRGTIQNSGTSGTYHVALDGIYPQQPHLSVAGANVEICKPLLFDFRNVNRAVLFANAPPPPPPGFHNSRIFHEQNFNGTGIRIVFRAAGSISTTGQENLHRGFQDTLEEVQRLVRTRNYDPDAWAALIERVENI